MRLSCRAALRTRSVAGSGGRDDLQVLPHRPGGAGASRVARRTVVLGDLHGDSVALRVILREAGLTDLFGRWCGGSARLVQVGDCIDRGPDSDGVLDLLAELQTTARATGGEVVRLIGNHELDLAAGYVRARSGLRDPARTCLRLREEMLTGGLVAAVALEGLLFVHGGFTARSLRELGRWTGSFRPVVGPEAVAAALNRMLRLAAWTGRFRGGPFAWDGPFRTYAPAEIRRGARAPGFVQVVGHSVHASPFRGLPHLLTVDQGVSVAMRGRRSFLEIAPEETDVACRAGTPLTWWHEDRRGRWRQQRRELPPAPASWPAEEPTVPVRVRTASAFAPLAASADAAE